VSRSYPYLHKSVSRHGQDRWYVWRRPGPKIRIKGSYGSPEFIAAYKAALWGDKPPEKPKDAPGSLAALIDAYMASPAWERLSPATQRQRANIFARVKKKAGQAAFVDFDRATVIATRDKLGPGAAKHFVQTMRGMFGWAVETGQAGVDPTAGVKVARPATDGFHAWTEEEISAFEARWPIGTRERLWLAVLLFTGLRRGDAVRIGPGNVKNGVLTLSTGKTGVVVTLPVAAELQAVLDASPLGVRTFIATVHRTPMTKEFFGNLFREACDKAGLKHCSAHGLRKAAATRLAEAGATVPQLNAVFGWIGAKQALHYVEKADRARLARDAFAKRYVPTENQ
jgi:integrase